jgi:hypothetical protein
MGWRSQECIKIYFDGGRTALAEALVGTFSPQPRPFMLCSKAPAVEEARSRHAAFEYLDLVEMGNGANGACDGDKPLKFHKTAKGISAKT